MKVTAQIKLCCRCKEEKSLSEFSKNSRTKDGYKYQCKTCIRLDYFANQDKEKQKRKTHYNQNKEKYLIWSRKAKQRCKEKIAQYNKEWRLRNLSRCAGYTAKYKTQKRRAMPKWANEFFIEEAYHLAHLRTKMTGYSWHVDHIVPLQGKTVCGLHVENNLQVIPACLNHKKSNKHESH